MKSPRIDSMSSNWIRDRDFWVRYFSAGVELLGCTSLHEDARRLWPEDIDDIVIPFKFRSTFGLSLSIFGDHELMLTHASLPEPAILGHMNCHQMSDAFRWEEYEQIIAYLSSQSPEQYPLWASKLLLSFYVAPTKDCIDNRVDVVRDSLNESGLFLTTEAEYVANYARRVVRKDFQWAFSEPKGWYAEGKRNYSLRNTRNKGLPFNLVREFFTGLESTL